MRRMKPLHIQTPTDLKTGLTAEQVRQAKANILTFREGKPMSRILADHIFTYFNLVNLILAVLIFTTGSYRNMMFLGAVIFSSGAGIYQEWKARRTLESMAILYQPRYSVLRNGKYEQLGADQIVAGDLISLKRGDQVPVDGVLVSGTAVVDEGVLSGESEGIVKNAGSSLYSGSDLLSGTCLMQAVLVGDETFANGMLKKASHFSRTHSPLKDGINAIIKICSLCILPAGLALMFRFLSILHEGWNTAVLSTSAALIGMIPEGLVVLSSLALLTAAAKLSRRDVLVQELYCLEGLAEADRLCMDKTGTITTGDLHVECLVPFEGTDLKTLKEDLIRLYAPLKDDNESAQAIWSYLEKETEPKPETPLKVIPFSSQTKYAQADYKDLSIRAGAIGFAVDLDDPKQKELANSYMEQGNRVLAVAISKGNEPFIPIGLILLGDTLRPDVKAILNFFRAQDITLTIISGDSEKTIQAVAQKAGLEGKALNCSSIHPFDAQKLCMDYTIFGRATPDQKEALIKAFQEKGERCAMIGDGVNDLLALKQANCSIAMGSGSQAAKAVAQMVLIKNQFERLPDIFYDGRRVVCNLQQAATLFLVKTVFSFCLCLLSLVWMEIYPFAPIQLTLISALFIGIPAFFLTFAKTNRKASLHFLKTVLLQAIPGGLAIVIVCAMAWLMKGWFGWPENLYRTLCAVQTAIVMGINLFWLISGSFLFRLGSVLIYEVLFFAAAIFLAPVFFFTAIPANWLWVLLIPAGLGFALSLIHPILNRQIVQ